MALAFRVRLKTDSDGSLLVTCPALPEVTTFGEDRADAMRRGRNAVEEALAARMYAGENIPIGERTAPISYAYPHSSHLGSRCIGENCGYSESERAELSLVACRRNQFVGR